MISCLFGTHQARTAGRFAIGSWHVFNKEPRVPPNWIPRKTGFMFKENRSYYMFEGRKPLNNWNPLRIPCFLCLYSRFGRCFISPLTKHVGWFQFEPHFLTGLAKGSPDFLLTARWFFPTRIKSRNSGSVEPRPTDHNPTRIPACPLSTRKRALAFSWRESHKSSACKCRLGTRGAK